MKFPSRDELGDYTRAISIGALKGAAVGSVASVGIYAFMKRRGTLNQVGTFARTFFIMSPALGAGVTNMEWASRRFEETRYGYVTGSNRPAEAPESTWGKFKHYCGEHKLSVMFTGWAASLGLALYINGRDKYLTRSQKLVQARVWAQGFTVLLLIAAAFVSTQKPSEDRAEEASREADSWKIIVAQEEQRLNALAAKKTESNAQ